MKRFEKQAVKVMKDKSLSEVTFTSDGLSFYSPEMARKHALKNRLELKKFTKDKK